jgi:hypothetical protein
MPHYDYLDLETATLASLQTPIFPRLRHFHAGVTTQLHIIPLVCPSIEIFTFNIPSARTFYQSPGSVGSILDPVIPSQPNHNLLRLTLLRGSTPAPTFPPLSNLQSFFSNGDVEASALFLLSTFPNLTVLDCNLGSKIIAPAPRSQYFPSLRSVSLGVSDDTTVLHFLQSITSPHIRLMGIQLTHGSRITEKMTSGIATLASSSLRSLSILWEHSPGTQRRCANITDLRPLHDCHLLEAVVLCCYEIHDADIEEMAKAWPALQLFQLRSSGVGREEPRPTLTLRSLYSFALHCPHIHQIRLAVDATAGIPPLEEMKANPNYKPSSLRTLDLQASSCGKVRLVAEFLGRLFTLLRALNVLDWEGDDFSPLKARNQGEKEDMDDARWDQVIDQMPLVRRGWPAVLVVRHRRS